MDSDKLIVYEYIGVQHAAATGGGKLPDTDLAFRGCTRETQATVYHITTAKRKQLYGKVYKLYAYTIK